MKSTRSLAFVVWCALSGAAHAQAWPSVDTDLPRVGGGENDAALIVGIDEYFSLADIPGAADNAGAWQQYLTRVRGVPAERTILLRGGEATKERIERALATTAQAARPGGTVWFLFIGHGAPSPAGDDGLLLGVDTQPDADSLSERGVSQKVVLAKLQGSRAKERIIVFDACFSGRTADGTAPLVKGLQATLPVRRFADPKNAVVFASSETFAGPLPGQARPAFSYLLLGGLRGWADADGDESVTVGEAFAFSKDALVSTVKTNARAPSVRGDLTVLVAKRVEERRPDVAAILLGRCPVDAKWDGFACAKPERVAAIVAPTISCPSGSSWSGNECVALCPMNTTWSGSGCVGKLVNCPSGASWNGETCIAERAASSVVCPPGSTWAGAGCVANPHERSRIDKRTGLAWKWIDGGSFTFGCEPEDKDCGMDERPALFQARKPTTVAGFWILQHEVTVRAYAACESNKHCSAAARVDDGDHAGNWANDRGAHPMNLVTHAEARVFCSWVEGDLPSDAEWEFAGKSGGSTIWPWGDDWPMPQDKRANFRGPGDGFERTAPVGSFPEGATESGLSDMAGNVAEWTSASRTRGTIEVRGGSYKHEPSSSRLSARLQFSVTSRLPNVGFRCVQYEK